MLPPLGLQRVGHDLATEQRDVRSEGTAAAKAWGGRAHHVRWPEADI